MWAVGTANDPRLSYVLVQGGGTRANWSCLGSCKGAERLVVAFYGNISGVCGNAKVGGKPGGRNDVTQQERQKSSCSDSALCGGGPPQPTNGTVRPKYTSGLSKPGNWAYRAEQLWQRHPIDWLALALVPVCHRQPPMDTDRQPSPPSATLLHVGQPWAIVRRHARTQRVTWQCSGDSRR